MGLLMLCIEIIIIFLILYSYFDDLSDVIIIGFVFFNAIIVLFAEVLSIFTYYNLIGNSIMWGGIIFETVCFFRTRIKAGFQKAGSVIKNKKITFSMCVGVIWWIAIGAITIIAISKSLMYPPQNCDSLIYHLPRSFLYWKNESIHNMPFSHRRGLYGGPFNAILMTQLRVFTNGSDYFLNLIQLPSYLIASLACGGIAEYFCIDKKYLIYKKRYKYISMFLILTVPMALLQASTTQNDLLVGSFSLITLSLLIKYLHQNKKLFLD